MHVAHGNWLPEEAKLHQERDELERVLKSCAKVYWLTGNSNCNIGNCHGRGRRGPYTVHTCVV